MSERTEDKPDIWVQIGSGGVSEHRKEEMRRRSKRESILSFLFLVPLGVLILIAGWTLLRLGGDLRGMGAPIIVLGFTILLAAATLGLRRKVKRGRESN